MDLVKEAIFLGFSGAAVMDTKELVFVPEYRTFCTVQEGQVTAEQND